MRRKLKAASVISLAATLSVMLFSAEGSRANAEATEISATTAAAQAQDAMGMIVPVPTFVSEPVVQPLPEEPEQEETEPAVRAASLRELVATSPIPADLDEQLRCLAGAIYFESKGESLAGQLAVGRVVIARAESPRFPSSYCGVVYQRSQFSFVRGGRMPAINTASKAWQRAKKLAVIAQNEQWESPAEGALFFHADYVAPRWRTKMARLAQIDNHIFYR